MALQDDDIMPWGVHAGKKMEDVPASYLIWLHENNKCHGEVRAYIVENLDFLKLEAKQKSKGNE
ncbi:MAG TPA: hypothetical protein DGG95_08295 [Cytophagales bacterium]|jgi:uncharacterized protein (DUF3820 family)|nr:hypothetical protein [Cytophagales bacterium]